MFIFALVRYEQGDVVYYHFLNCLGVVLRNDFYGICVEICRKDYDDCTVFDRIITSKKWLTLISKGDFK